MTSEQQRIINELLPKGYSLQFASKPARSKSGSFTKNIATAAAFNRQNVSNLKNSNSNYPPNGFSAEHEDGQLRNSNGQFASSVKSMKHTKYGGGKLVSQDNFAMPSPAFQPINSGMMNQGGYNMKNNYSNPNNNGMMTPQMMHQTPQMGSAQQQQVYNQMVPLNLNGQPQQMNMQGLQNSQLMHQQSQNNQQQQQQQHQQQLQNQNNQQQQQGNQQQQPMQNEMNMYGSNNGGDYYQQQNQQQQMTQQQYQMHMHQMQQQNLYDQSTMHMKPTGVSRKLAAKPRKEKKVKLAEKALKPKRKSDGTLAAKVTKKSQAAAAAAMMMSGGMMSEEHKKCLHILHSLQKHKSSIPFLRPVDPVKQGCADYLLVIRDPMDLSTVERNLKTHQYQSPTQFAADIRKIWNNSYLYNSRESQIYNMTLEMDKYFEKKYKEMETRVYGNSQVKHLPTIIKFFEQAMKGNKQTSTVTTPTPRSSSQPAKKAKNPPSKMDIPMTMQEKKNLGQNILQLPPECLRGVWEIVKSDSNQQYDDKTLTFDIDALPVRKTRELEQYVKQNNTANSKRLSKKQAKVQEKSMNAENKLIQQTFCQDDETAATHHETVIAQDTTQSTIQHTQQYQVPMHPSQYPIDQMHMQSIRQYGNGQNDYMQHNHQHDNNGTNQNDYQDDLNDLDSDSSQMSADSDSQN